RGARGEDRRARFQRHRPRNAALRDSRGRPAGGSDALPAAALNVCSEFFSGRREGPVLYSEVVDINNKNKLKVLRKVTSGFLPAVGTFKTVQRHGREPDATQPQAIQYRTGRQLCR